MSYRKTPERISIPGIYEELMQCTLKRAIMWVRYKDFVEHLEIQGIAYDDIPWFYSYWGFMRTVGHFPLQSNTFFSVYQKRLFAVSQSTLLAGVRIDTSSSFDNMSIWRRVYSREEDSIALLSEIQSTYKPNNDMCEKLLEITDCIHV